MEWLLTPQLWKAGCCWPHESWHLGGGGVLTSKSCQCSWPPYHERVVIPSVSVSCGGGRNLIHGGERGVELWIMRGGWSWENGGGGLTPESLQNVWPRVMAWELSPASLWRGWPLSHGAMVDYCRVWLRPESWKSKWRLGHSGVMDSPVMVSWLAPYVMAW